MISRRFLPSVCLFGVGDGGLVVAHAGDGDPPQGIVGLAVAAPVKPVAYGPSRRRLDGTGAAQCCEGRFRLHAFGLSPAVTNRAAAVSAPTPEAANSAGLTWAQRWLMSVVSSSISAVSA